MPNIVKSFFYVKKSSHHMFSSVKAFHNGLGKPEEMIIRGKVCECVCGIYVFADDRNILRSFLIG